MDVNLLFGRKFPPYFTKQGENSPPFLITLDAAIKENHQYSNKVSQFPVEGGIDKSDNIKQQPETLSIDGIVTASPVPYLGAKPIEVVGQERVVTAYDILLRIAGMRIYTSDSVRSTESSDVIIVDIFTPLRTFTDMAITSLQIPRDQSTGEALRFNASFQRIYIAELAEEQINNAVEKKQGSGGTKDQAQKKVDKGKTNTTKPEAEKGSYLVRLIDKARGK